MYYQHICTQIQFKSADWISVHISVTSCWHVSSRAAVAFNRKTEDSAIWTIKLNVMFCSKSIRIKEGGPLSFAPTVSNHSVKSKHSLHSQSSQLNVTALRRCIRGLTLIFITLLRKRHTVWFWAVTVQRWQLWKKHGRRIKEWWTQTVRQLYW